MRRASTLMGWAMLALVITSACGSPPPQLSAEQLNRHHSVDPRARLCGNGVVDEGEACDPNVEWEDDCPGGWGMCWDCAPGCRSWKRVYLSRNNYYAVFGRSPQTHAPRLVEAIPPCEVAPTARTTFLGAFFYVYDELGRLVQRGNATDGWKVEWKNEPRPPRIDKEEKPDLSYYIVDGVPRSVAGQPDLIRSTFDPDPIVRDNRGRVVSYDNGTRVYRLRYDDADRVISEDDGVRSAHWSYHRDTAVRTMNDSRTTYKLRDGLVVETRYELPEGRMVEQRQYEYDGARRLSKIFTHWCGNADGPCRDTEEIFHYGEFGIERHMSGGKIRAQWVYDASGLLMFKQQDGWTYRYAYDPAGRPVWAQRYKGAMAETDEWEWHDDGRIRSTGSAQWEYDERGYPTQRLTKNIEVPTVDFGCHSDRFAQMPRRRFRPRSPKSSVLPSTIGCFGSGPFQTACNPDGIPYPDKPPTPPDPIIRWPLR